MVPIPRVRTVATLATLAAAVRFMPQPASAQIARHSEQTLSSRVDEYETAQAAIENHGRVPDSLVAVVGSSKLRHWSNVIAVAWSPDGSLLGSVGGDGCLRLWNADKGEQVKRFKSEPAWRGGAPHLSSLAFEPAGKRVAIGMGTNALRVWDLETGAETHFLKDDAPVRDVAWHPTQSLLVTGGELVVKLWDLSAGRVVRVFDSQDKSFRRQDVRDSVQVAFSPDGNNVVVGHPDGSVRLWNVDTGEVTRTIQARGVAVQAIAIDGRRDCLATAGRDGKLHLWRLSTGEAFREVQTHKDDVEAIAFHPRDDAIYSGGSDGMIRKWDLQTGEKLLEWAASRLGPSSLAVHPSRDLLASAGFAVRVWHSATGKPHGETGEHLGGIESLKFTPDGSRLVTASNDATVRVWDSKNWQPIATYDLDAWPAPSIDLTHNGKLFVTLSHYSGKVNIRYLKNGVLLNSFTAEGGSRQTAAVSGDGKWLAVAADDWTSEGALTIWDVTKNALHGKVLTHGGHVYFSGDSSRLLLVGSGPHGNGTRSRLSVWDVESLEKTLSLEDVQGLARITANALSADGKTLVLAGYAFDQNDKSRRQLVFWDWTRNETRLVVDLKDHLPANMAIAPDGRSLLTASALEGQVRIWDLRDAALRKTIRLREAGPWAIWPAAFTPDSSQVVIGMGNGTIYILRVHEPPANVALKTAVPAPAEEPPPPAPDPWTELLGQPAPEFQAEGWLFGEPTTLKALRGKWVVLYFWTGPLNQDQDMPTWMEMQQRFGDKAPTVIIVNPAIDGSLDDVRGYFDHYSRESWEGRTLPFRVLLDKSKPNVIPGTRVETGGATFAAYRVMNALRGSRPPSLALLIAPDGTVKQSINNPPYRWTLGQLEGLMGVKAGVPKWERELLKEYTLRPEEKLRRFAPPYSQAREDFRFFNQGRGPAVLTFVQDETVRPHWNVGVPEMTLEMLLNYVLGFERYEFIDHDNVLQRRLAGDWCLRTGASRAELLRALETILKADLGWKVRFEREALVQPVVVASGKWRRRALRGVEDQKTLFITADDVPDSRSGGGGMSSLDDMFKYLGNRTRVRFVNQTADAPQDSFWWQERLTSKIEEIVAQTAEGKKHFERMLNNLSLQTSLELQIEEREAVVWRVVVD